MHIFLVMNMNLSISCQISIKYYWNLQQFVYFNYPHSFDEVIKYLDLQVYIHVFRDFLTDLTW